MKDTDILGFSEDSPKAMCIYGAKNTLHFSKADIEKLIVCLNTVMSESTWLDRKIASMMILCGNIVLMRTKSGRAAIRKLFHGALARIDKMEAEADKIVAIRKVLQEESEADSPGVRAAKRLHAAGVTEHDYYFGQNEYNDFPSEITTNTWNELRDIERRQK
jgi:hypothetical protein